MRVVIDANVLIAAFASRGLCHALMELCIANDEMIVTEEILKDVQDKLIKKIKIPSIVVSKIAIFLRNYTQIVTPAFVDVICRDPDDRNVLGAARQAIADYIITGDDDLLSLKSIDSTRIVSPRQYWEIFSEKKKT